MFSHLLGFYTNSFTPLYKCVTIVRFHLLTRIFSHEMRFKSSISSCLRFPFQVVPGFVGILYAKYGNCLNLYKGTFYMQNRYRNKITILQD